MSHFKGKLLPNNHSALLQCLTAFHSFWSGNSGTTCPPIEKVGPTVPRQFESAADDLLACAFHDAGSDRQSAFELEVVAHSVGVGLVVVNAVRDGFRRATT